MPVVFPDLLLGLSIRVADEDVTNLSLLAAVQKFLPGESWSDPETLRSSCAVKERHKR